MAPGARNKFSAQMFETEAFRLQMYSIEEFFVALLGLFGAWGSVPPWPLVTPLPGSNHQYLLS